MEKYKQALLNTVGCLPVVNDASTFDVIVEETSTMCRNRRYKQGAGSSLIQFNSLCPCSMADAMLQLQWFY